MAEVHPEQRGAALAGQLRGPQDRAVAADDDRRPRSRRRRRAVGSTTSTSWIQVQVVGLVREQPDGDAVLVQRRGRTSAATSRASARPVWAITSTRRSSGVLSGSVTVPPSHRGPPGPRCDVPRRGSRPPPPRARRLPQPEEELDVARRARAAGWWSPPARPSRGVRPRPLPRSTASARRSRSRTTPPLPTRSLPTSNCGLTISARSPSGASHRDQRVEHQLEGDEGEVADDQVHRRPDQLEAEVADVGAVVHDDPLVAAAATRPAGRSRRRPPPPSTPRRAAARR